MIEDSFRRKVEISMVISDIQQGWWAKGPAAFLSAGLYLRTRRNAGAMAG
jgi:hypothetical protein